MKLAGVCMMNVSRPEQLLLLDMNTHMNEPTFSTISKTLMSLARLQLLKLLLGKPLPLYRGLEAKAFVLRFNMPIGGPLHIPQLKMPISVRSFALSILEEMIISLTVILKISP